MRIRGWTTLLVGVALIAGCTSTPRSASSEPSNSVTQSVTASPTPSPASALASPESSTVLSSAPAGIASASAPTSPPVAVAETTYRGPRAVAFPTASHGVLLALDCASLPGRCQVFTKVSDDGGVTWSAPTVLTAVSWLSQDPPWNTLGANNLVFTTADDGYAYGPDLYQTRDGGRTWRQLPVSGQVAAAAATADGVWLAVLHGCGDYGCTGWDLDAVDAQGQVRALAKQPAPIAPPPGVTKVGVPTQLLRPDAATAYLIGFDNLQVTHNGGASWTQATFPCKRAYDDTVDFSVGSSTMLWAACASESGAGMQQKQLWRSTDSGANWGSPLPLESDGYSSQITAVNSEVAWRYGDRGNVLHTADGGRTWQVMLPDLFNQAYGPPTAFAALDEDAWIFDPYGPYDADPRHLYLTTNAGQSWRTITFTSLAVTTAASAASGATKACTSAQLAVTLGERGQAMNQPAIAVIFTNTSPTPCTLFGYPGVAGLDARGNQLVQAYRTPQVYTGGAPDGVPQHVTLASGAQASALIGGTAQPVNGQTTCPPDYAAVLVTPPGTTTPTKLSVDFPSCEGLAITPVVPGPTGGAY